MDIGFFFSFYPFEEIFDDKLNLRILISSHGELSGDQFIISNMLIRNGKLQKFDASFLLRFQISLLECLLYSGEVGREV